jgi:protein ImuB
VATDPPDGIFIYIAGAAHLFKCETALLQDLKNRMAASKIASRVAVADTPGCGWAVARYGKEEIVAPGRASEWLGSLPVRALRLAPATVESLRDVGIERIAQLASKPRASLQPRFGSELPLRMDQALGSAAEVLISIVPPEVPRNRLVIRTICSASSASCARVSRAILNGAASARGGSIWFSCGSTISRKP